MEYWLALLKDFGPVVGIIVFFLWRDWQREDRLNARVEALEKYNQETLVSLVKQAIQVIAQNTEQWKWTGVLIQSCHSGRVNDIS